MAPELLEGDVCTPTRASDMYAYAMTSYEILSGKIPFESVLNDAAVLLKVIRGQRPERVDPCDHDEIWDIIIRCWAQEPENRPSAAEVLESFLHNLTIEAADPHTPELLRKAIKTSISPPLVDVFLTRSGPKLNDYTSFGAVLKQAKNIVVLAGSGLSAASGLPTFYDTQDGRWGYYSLMSIGSARTFHENPSQFWKICHYYREAARHAIPSSAHQAIALLCSSEDELRRVAPSASKFCLVTRNIDNLSNRALPSSASMSSLAIEMCGNIFTVNCTNCNLTEWNFDSPICDGLAGTEADIEDGKFDQEIDIKELPTCSRCSGLLRPGVTWLDRHVDLQVRSIILRQCDLVLIVGMAPFFMSTFLEQDGRNNRKVAVFNIKPPSGIEADFVFLGPCQETLIKALDLEGRVG
ncbi:DHS-like NAD/FAD-binding domain containing protein [Amanita muscaria]